MNDKSKECCPKFIPARWDQKTFKWDHKTFIKSSIPTLFHMPVPSMIGKKITKMMKQSQAAQKSIPNEEDTLLLFNDPHAFKSDIYLSVTGKVPGAVNTDISGNFMSKVYDGPYNAIPKFMKNMDNYLEKKNKKALDYYVHYAYCPGCAKKYGHNYMILFAKV